VTKIPRALLSLVLATLAGGAGGVEFGINARHAPGDAAAVAALMAQRQFRSARVDMVAGADQAALREFARLVRANGGRVQAVLQTSHQWDLRCDPDLARVEREAYRQADSAVRQVQDVVQEFELLNEMQRNPAIEKEVPWNTAGASAAPYAGKPCAAALAAVLRGMSRAVADVRSASGLPLRTVLGVIGRDFGYLAFLRAQGVQWDVTGFHVYPHVHARSLLDDRWYGPGGPLAQLAAFGKPVHVNEFNCGETYDRDYENQPGRPRTEACLRSLSRHLRELQRSQAAMVEAVHFYELLDEPIERHRISRAPPKAPPIHDAGADRGCL
jgi:hypothetical protein